MKFLTKSIYTFSFWLLLSNPLFADWIDGSDAPDFGEELTFRDRFDVFDKFLLYSSETSTDAGPDGAVYVALETIRTATGIDVKRITVLKRTPDGKSDTNFAFGSNFPRYLGDGDVFSPKILRSKKTGMIYLAAARHVAGAGFKGYFCTTLESGEIVPGYMTNSTATGGGCYEIPIPGDSVFIPVEMAETTSGNIVIAGTIGAEGGSPAAIVIRPNGATSVWIDAAHDHHEVTSISCRQESCVIGGSYTHEGSFRKPFVANLSAEQSIPEKYVYVGTDYGLRTPFEGVTDIKHQPDGKVVFSATHAESWYKNTKDIKSTACYLGRLNSDLSFDTTFNNINSPVARGPTNGMLLETFGFATPEYGECDSVAVLESGDLLVAGTAGQGTFPNKHYFGWFWMRRAKNGRWLQWSSQYRDAFGPNMVTSIKNIFRADGTIVFTGEVGPVCCSGGTKYMAKKIIMRDLIFRSGFEQYY